MWNVKHSGSNTTASLHERQIFNWKFLLTVSSINTHVKDNARGSPLLSCYTHWPLEVKMLIGHLNGVPHHLWSETDTVASACSQAAPPQDMQGEECVLKSALRVIKAPSRCSETIGSTLRWGEFTWDGIPSATWGWDRLIIVTVSEKNPFTSWQGQASLDAHCVS